MTLRGTLPLFQVVHHPTFVEEHIVVTQTTGKLHTYTARFKLNNNDLKKNHLTFHHLADSLYLECNRKKNNIPHRFIDMQYLLMTHCIYQ